MSSPCYIFRQFFLGFPVEIEDAARVDGATRWTVFIRIAVPMARSAALASTILLFTTNWNAYLWPLLITFTQQMYTLPVGVAQYSSVSGNFTQVSSFGPAMAASTSAGGAEPADLPVAAALLRPGHRPDRAAGMTASAVTSALDRVIVADRFLYSSHPPLRAASRGGVAGRLQPVGPARAGAAPAERSAGAQLHRQVARPRPHLAGAAGRAGLRVERGRMRRA